MFIRFLKYVLSIILFIDWLSIRGNAVSNERIYQVYRIVPQNKDQLTLMNALHNEASDYELDFWKAPRGVGVFSDVMVPPEAQSPLKQLLTRNNISFFVTIDDVERLIMKNEHGDDFEKSADSKKGENNSSLLLSSFLRRLMDTSSWTDKSYPFGSYGSYGQMQAYMKSIERKYPHMARVFDLAYTHENRRVQGIKIGHPVYRTDKKIIWIDGGIHAREWAASHTALYFISQLIGKYGTDPVVTHYVNSVNFYIVPCLNPDGYEYSKSAIRPWTRMWRKNRSPKVCTLNRRGRKKCCHGVDLNRNFDIYWSTVGSSNDPCSEVYQGKAAFSEPETRGVKRKMLSTEMKGKVEAFITMHTYAQFWMHPYGFQSRTYPDDVLELKSIGSNAIKALKGKYNTPYRVGSAADILYASSGGADDWAKMKAHVKYVYLLELRPEEQVFDGFVLKKAELIPTGVETWQGLKVVIDAVLKKNNLSNVPPASTRSPSISRNTEQQQHQRRLAGKSGSRREWHLRWKPRRGPCRDKNVYCPDWVRTCVSSQIYMRENCALSCKYCTP